MSDPGDMKRYGEAIPEAMRRVRERLEQHYGFERWGRPVDEAAAGPAIEGAEYRPEPPEGFVLTAEGDHHSRYRADRTRAYVYEMEGGRGGGGGAVQVVVATCPSPEAARASVMDVLASQMAVRLEPADSLGIGDVAFAQKGEDPTFILFARGSLAFQVRSVGTVPVPVAAFARKVDPGG